MSRRFLKPGILGAFLCGFVQVCSAASPAADASYPTVGWTVGPIGAKSNNGISYCSMKNAYQGGQSLVLARDDRGSNSIAVDLHQDIFDAGRQYNVKVRTGSVSRNVIGLAATKQVMALQMGVDKIFYNKLLGSHDLVFTIEKSDYGFDLDVSAGNALAALRRCTDSFRSTAVFTETQITLGKPSDAASVREVEKESAIDESGESEDTTAASPPPLKKHHKSSKKKQADDTGAENLQAEPAAQQQFAEEDPGASPSVSQATQVREDMKAEMAHDIINIWTHHGQQQQSATSAAGVPSAPAVSRPIAPAIPQQPVDNTALKALLEKSRVVSADQVKSGDNGTVISWTSPGDLYGSAQQLPLTPGETLSDKANDYVQKTAALCKGQFAQKMGEPRKAGKLDVLEAQITCLDGQNDAAAAVLFIGDKSKFSIVTQEGTIDQLVAAMASRDSIIAAATAAN